MKKRLARIWHVIETTDTEMADALRPHQGTPGAQGEAGGRRRGGKRATGGPNGTVLRMFRWEVLI